MKKTLAAMALGASLGAGSAVSLSEKIPAALTVKPTGPVDCPRGEVWMTARVRHDGAVKYLGFCAAKE
jgi:hypothetical protein